VRFAARPQLNRYPGRSRNRADVVDVVIHPRHGGDRIVWDKNTLTGHEFRLDLTRETGLRRWCS